MTNKRQIDQWIVAVRGMSPAQPQNIAAWKAMSATIIATGFSLAGAAAEKHPEMSALLRKAAEEIEAIVPAMKAERSSPVRHSEDPNRFDRHLIGLLAKIKILNNS